MAKINGKAKALRAQPLPRFSFELAAAAFLTLAAILLGGKYAAAPAPVKVSAQAPPLRAAENSDDHAVAEFMERFALSRVAPPLPDLREEPVRMAALAGPAPKPVAAPVKEKTRPLAFKPTPSPAPRAVERRPAPAMETRRAEPAADAPRERRIPVFSDLADRLPSGRNIADGFTSMGRRVGSIFSRG